MALDTDLQQSIDHLWPTLAQPVKSSIAAQDYKHAVRDASAQFALSEVALAAIEMEVLLVLMGLQSQEEFVTTLPTVEGLTVHDATTLTAEIDTHLFAPLAPYLTPVDEVAVAAPTAPAHPLSSGGSTSPLEQFVVKDAAVRERFEKLPETVREAILAHDVANAFSTTVRNNDLSQEQFVTLGTLALQVMVGLATTKDFRARATEQQLVDERHIKALVADVEQNMFKPVRDAIVHALDKRKQT